MIQCISKNKNHLKKKRKLRLKITIIVFCIVALLKMIDNRLRPVITSMTADQAKTISTNLINKVIIDELSESNIEYSDLIKIERDQSGKVLAINTNIKKVNLLKATISEHVQNNISEFKIRKVKVPLGTLIGSEIFTGRGPSLRLKIISSGNISTELKSTFSNAGINQTRHQIYMNVNTEIFALVPGYPVNTGVETNVIIAETIIVGEVPKIIAHTADIATQFEKN